jgi:arylsulfatase A-like enzyme
MYCSGTDATSTDSAWHVAFFPTFALLGITLPISLLTSVERYLYYLRPLELVPAYGTAWLFLAAVGMPVSLLFALALKALDRTHGSGSVRRSLVALLIGVAAAAVVGAFADGAVTWLRTFGLLAGVHLMSVLAAASIGAGILIASLPAGRMALLKLYGPAKYCAAVGALSVLSLPFSGWGSGAPTDPAGHPPGAATASSRPNILLVTIDTLSAEHMSLYGATRPTTPSLDAFASEATVFDRAYANANFTTAGIASILTATRPWTHRALQLPTWPIARVRANSLPAVLSRAGYQTAYVATSIWASAAKNGLGLYFNFDATDEIESLSQCRDRLAAALPYSCPATELPLFWFAGRLLEKARQIAFDSPPNWQYDPRAAIRPALRWLAEADKRTPIFLWVHFLPPHSPYAAPKPWLGSFDSSNVARTVADSDTEQAFLFRSISTERAHVLEARYDESVAYIDYFVGEFLNKGLGLLGDNTVLIVTADHGESFAHGYGMHSGPGLFESIIHIPLMIKLPSQAHGVRTSVVAEQVDIAPTIAQLAGLAPSPAWEGRPLLEGSRSTEGDAPVAAKPVFSMNFEENPRLSALTTGSVAVIDKHWKLVHYMGALHYRSMPQLHDQLYDLAADPGELVNRITDQPGETERLRALIAAELVQHGGALP